ncbi:MAG TPA: heavy metal-binding domain-containing protein [Candidatus Omnitrophota bacterium]|nr:heavy metal-binding domain-containing protein [Candidatus Omnitrophota bacterium]
MKIKWFVIVALSAAFIFVRLASAAEEHEHKEGKEEIPAAISGIWVEVKEHEEQLEKIIADKKLDKVHEVAFEISDMVNALSDKSMDLPPENLAKVKSNAKYVANIAERLDESGDAADQVATEANFKKLQDFLKTIEAQYPPEILVPPQVSSGNQEVKKYVCPMDGYVSDEPGKCPKCGMNLEEKEMTAVEPEAVMENTSNKE